MDLARSVEMAAAENRSRRFLRGYRMVASAAVVGSLFHSIEGAVMALFWMSVLDKLIRSHLEV